MKNVTNTGTSVPETRSNVKFVSGRRFRVARYTTHLVWRAVLHLMQRLTHTRGDGLEFKIGFSVRDLVSDKSRAVKDQMEALAAAVQKAGSYQVREEAVRAVHAVMEALTDNDRIPPKVLVKLSKSLPVREAARLRRAAAERLHKK